MEELRKIEIKIMKEVIREVMEGKKGEK
jgi:hypothetical protein